ncbi:MAG: DNA polymerase III subunit gamma/tau, partial [Gammaproteobacteria bacterium]|nr:DNA polymerase III subunit gamma/tau [Gammaproteobacteria bacterium]
DEVHMFSNHSFNALLKTLEEPPPHVKFLLATTDPQKLPVTILSRCLQFNLKRLPVSLIISHLQHVLTAENVEHNVTALQLIAEAADGSMRDALSLLDQALAFGAGTVQELKVRDMLGSVSRDKVILLLKAVLQRDATQTMKAVAALAEFSPDFENVLAELLSLLHHMSLAKTVPEALDEFVSARETLLKLCEQVSAEDLHLFYQIALIGRRDLPLSPDARNGFEMILLRMLAFRPASVGSAGVDAARLNHASAQPNSQPGIKPQRSAQNTTVSNTVSSAGAQLSSTGSVADGSGSPVYDSPPASRPAASGQNTAVQPPSIQPASAQAVSSDWREVVNALGLGGLVKQLAINCTMQQRDGCKIILHIASGHSNLINLKAKQRLQQALGEYFNIDAQLEIKVVNQNETGSKSGKNNETPAQTTQRETDQRQQQAEQSINEDSFTQTLKENFNAELIPGSVKPVS